jgi:hypothetical protein
MSRPIRIWRLLNLDCSNATHLASESLDRDLDRPEWFALGSHILCCWSCRRYLRQIRLVRCALRLLATHLETGQPLPGPGLPDDARARIKHSLKSE